MPKRKRNFRWIKWLLFLVLIAAAVVVVFLVKNTYFNDKKDDDKTIVDDNMGTKEKKIEDDKDKDDTKEEEKAPQYDGDSPNTSEALTGLITYANVTENNLIIRVNIDQFLQSGNCSLTVSRNGVTYYTQAVGVQESVTTSTCDGFDIPVSDLPKGDLQVEILLESNGKSGKIASKVKI